MLKTSNFKQLLLHQFYSYKRSAFWRHSIIINVLLTFLLLYLILNLVIIGLYIDKIFIKTFPDENPVKIFTKFLFYFLLFDFIIRFFIQKIPALEIEPYLHLPIKKSKLFHFILFKSALNLFNILPLIVLIPFAIKVIIPEYSLEFAIIWLLIFLGFFLMNNYFSFTLKKIFVQKPLRTVLLFAFIVFFIYLDSKNILSISKYFVQGVLRCVEYPLIFLVPFALAIIAYNIAYRFLKRSSYLENIGNSSKSMLIGSRDISFIKGKGKIGELLNLEIKLILRNKRPRSYFLMSGLFLLYGFLFYPKPDTGDNYFILIGVGIFMTGILLLQYGQLVFAWESSYFDRLFTANISVEDFFQEKYFLFSTSSIITFIITLPYAFYNYNIAIINFAMLLYNLGVNIYLILFSGRFNKKYVTLTRSMMMNYEGVSFVQFLLILPTIGLPFLIFLPFHFMNLSHIGIAVIGVIGILGILLKEQILLFLSSGYKKHKYKILSGFREG